MMAYSWVEWLFCLMRITLDLPSTFKNVYVYMQDFPSGSVGKESACKAGDPWVGKIPWDLGEGTGNPLQYSSLENYVDRGAGQATVYEIAESQTWLQLSLPRVYMRDSPVPVGCLETSLPSTYRQYHLSCDNQLSRDLWASSTGINSWGSKSKMAYDPCR